MRFKLSSMITSPFILASTTRLYKSMFFTLILSPSITKFRGILFVALCTTFFSSTRQFILGLKPTNSVMRCPLCSPLKMGPRQFLVEVEKRGRRRELALFHFPFVVVHELFIEDVRVIKFPEIEWLVHVTHLVNDNTLAIQLHDEWIRVLS